MEAAAGHRRGHRRRAAAALVLVAHQRLERSLGDDLGASSSRSPCRPRFGLDTDQAARFRLDHDRHRRRHDRRLARGDVPHAPRIRKTRWSPSTAARTLPPPAGGPSRGSLPTFDPPPAAFRTCSIGSAAACLIYGILFGTGKLLLEGIHQRLPSSCHGDRRRRRHLLGPLAARLEYSGGIRREIASRSFGSCVGMSRHRGREAARNFPPGIRAQRRRSARSIRRRFCSR